MSKWRIFVCALMSTVLVTTETTIGDITQTTEMDYDDHDDHGDDVNYDDDSHHDDGNHISWDSYHDGYCAWEGYSAAGEDSRHGARYPR